MLLPQSPRKARQEDLPPSLETPEECRRAEEREQALTLRARRREAEAGADRARFELTRDKITFAVELAVTVVALAAATIVLALHPELIPVTVLSGGGLSGLVYCLRRGPQRDDGG